MTCTRQTARCMWAGRTPEGGVQGPRRGRLDRFRAVQLHSEMLAYQLVEGSRFVRAVPDSC